MAVTVSTSNSYITLENAETYFEERLNSDAWEDANENDKKRALITSTKSIDRLNFSGGKTNDEQVLQFPRDDDASIPQTIKDATCENALMLLDDKDVEDEIERVRIRQESVADIKVAYDTTHAPENIMAGIASATAWMMLKPYLRNAGILSIKRV